MPPPSIEFLLNSLRTCVKETTLALYLHARVRTIGLEAHALLGNCLVSVFVEAGSICNARNVFDGLECKSECSWNSLIIAYVKCGEPQNALALCHTMGDDSVLLNEFAFVALLKACTNLVDVKKGCELHALIARKNVLGNNVIIGTALVDMYAKCGIPTMAQEVFDKLPDQDVVAWTALITGYAQYDYGEEALKCFELMQQQGVTPNATTFSSILKACGSIGAEDKGCEIHDEIVRKGLLKTNQVVGNALVDMYAKCGNLAKAREVFDMLPVQDTVTWTALISGYAQHDRGQDALKCFEHMQHQKVPVDVVTFVSSLKSCGSIVASDKGIEIYAEVTRRGLLETNSVLGAALVDMYAKCGMLANAQSVFNKLPDRDLESWNALISGYAHRNCGEDVLMCFQQMREEGFFPDAITFACILNTCGNIGAAEKGEELHSEVEHKGLFQTNLIVGNALVDMYAKCGLLAEAQEVFNMLQLGDAISWNALITGYAQIGDIDNVLRMFHNMKGESIQPNPITFISVLNVFRHAGLVDEGEILFESMSKEFGISPTLEHYTRMVDLLGHAGQLHKAEKIFKKMSSPPDIVIWLTLLGACRKWGNVELGRRAFKRTVKLDEKEAAAYFCMFDIYTTAGMLDEAKKVEAMRVRKQAWKHREVFEGLLS